MGTGNTGSGRKKKAPAAVKPAVDAEARRHLIEACAFFHADRFRPAEPGSYRQQDLAEAAAEIDTVLRRKGRAGRGRKA